MSHNTPPSRIIHFLITGISLNAAVTDVGMFTGLPAKYRISKLTGFDTSTSLTLATVDLRTAAAGAGTAIIAAYALAGLTAATKQVDCTLAVTTDYQTAATLYLRNITPQGGAATASFLLEIMDLT